MIARKTSVDGCSSVSAAAAAAAAGGGTGTGTGTGTTGADCAMGEGGGVTPVAEAPAWSAPAAWRIFTDVPNASAIPSVTLAIASLTILSRPLISQEDALTSTSPPPTLWSFLLKS